MRRLVLACKFKYNVTVHHNMTKSVKRQLKCGYKHMLWMYTVFGFEMGTCYQTTSGRARIEPVGNHKLVL